MVRDGLGEESRPLSTICAIFSAWVVLVWKKELGRMRKVAPASISSIVSARNSSPVSASCWATCSPGTGWIRIWLRSEEHTSELQSHLNLVCRLLLEKKNPGDGGFIGSN